MHNIILLKDFIESKLLDPTLILEYEKLKNKRIYEKNNTIQKLRDLDENSNFSEHLSLAVRYNDYDFLSNYSKIDRDKYIILFNIYFFTEYFELFLLEKWQDSFSLSIEISYHSDDEMIFPKLHYFIANNDSILYDHDSKYSNLYMDNILESLSIGNYIDYSWKIYLEDSWEQYENINMFLKK